MIDTLLPPRPWPLFLDPPARRRCADCRGPFCGPLPIDGLCRICRGRRLRGVPVGGLTARQSARNARQGRPNRPGSAA